MMDWWGTWSDAVTCGEERLIGEVGGEVSSVLLSLVGTGAEGDWDGE